MFGDIVQQAVNNQYNGTFRLILDVTLANPVTPGNLILCALAWQESNTPSGFQGAAALAEVTSRSAAHDGQYQTLFYRVVQSASDSQNIGVDFGTDNARYCGIWVAEIEGPFDANPFDSHAYNPQANPGTATDAIQSGTITPSVDGCFLAAFTQNTSNLPTTVLSGGTGWTMGAQASNGSFGGEVKVQTTAAAILATFSQTVSNSNKTTGIFAFKPGATANVDVAADPIGAVGSMSGSGQMAVSPPVAPIACSVSLFGQKILSVQRLASAIAATGSLSGLAAITEVVLINADPIAASSQLAAGNHLSVNRAVDPIAAAGDLLAQVSLSVNRLTTAITAGGSLDATVVTSNGVVLTADPIATTGSIEGQASIAVDIAAQLIGANGQLLGTVIVTSPGNVLINAGPIQVVGELQGAPVIDVQQNGMIGANGLVDGVAFTGLVVQATPIAGAGTLAGGYEISVDLPANVISSFGELTGEVIQNVLQAAAAIVAQGELVGTAQIIGPGQLGVITRPGIISNTPRYAVISITPRRGVLH